jgi:hypothetical protein
MVLTRRLLEETEEKFEKKSVRIVDFPTETQTGHFQNTGRTSYHLPHRAQYIHYYRTFLMANILFCTVLLLLKDGEESK